MFRNAFNKVLLNSARKTIENRLSCQNMLTYKPRQNFSRTDRFLKNFKQPIYLHLVGANLVVYLAWKTGLLSEKFLDGHFAISLDAIDRGRFYTPLTSSFFHPDFQNLTLKMLILSTIGRLTEMIGGRKVLLHLYLVGAFSSAFLVYTVNKHNNIYSSSAGAGGAIAAIIAYLILNDPNLFSIMLVYPGPVWLFGTVSLGLSFLNDDGAALVRGSSYLGGLVGGALYFLLTRKRF